MGKKKFKMPSAYAILIYAIVFIAIVTWFVPSGQYQQDEAGNFIAGSYEQIDSKPQGFWDMCMAPVYGMLGHGATGGGIEVALFILIIGGFLGVVDRTGALNAGIANLITHNRGKEKKLIVLLMVLFSLCGTSYGMCEETMAFYPLLIPIMVAAGFDTMTGVAIIMLGAGAGVLASTVNPFATGVGSQAIGINLGDGIGWRLLLFLVNVGICIAYVYIYAAKVLKNSSKSLVAETMEEDKKFFALPSDVTELSGAQKIILSLFALSFVILIASLIPWTSVIPGFTFFEDILNKLLAVPVLGTVLGKSALPFGSWYFAEITMLFFVMAIIIGKVYKLNEDSIIDSFMQGARDMIGAAFIVALARGIQVIMTDAEITATVLHWCEGMLIKMPKGLLGLVSFILYLPLSFLIPSTSGLAAATLPIIGPMADFVGMQKHVLVTAFQSASGIVNLITPTSGVVMGALAIARIPYSKWLVFCGKLLGILLVVNAVIICAAAMVV